MKEIIEHLRKLGKGEIKPMHHQFGLCEEMGGKFWRRFNGINHEFITHIAEKWPEFSGDKDYPVKGINYKDPYIEYSTRGNLWDKNPYGDSRRRLCLWLADYFEENDECLDEFIHDFDYT